jgi:hypothetical protein
MPIRPAARIENNFGDSDVGLISVKTGRYHFQGITRNAENL